MSETINDMKISFDNQESFLESIKGLVGNMDDLRTNGLERVAKFQERNTAAMEAEHKRLVAKYGANHPEAKQMQERLGINGQFKTNLGMEIERSKMAAVQIEQGTWRVQGQVLGTDGQGQAGLTVSLFDAKKGTWLRETGHTCTGPLGHFTLALSAELTKKYALQPTVLTLTDAKQKVLLQDPETVTAVTGQSDYRLLVLEKVTCEAPPPSSPDEGGNNGEVPPPPAELLTWSLKGQVIDKESRKGIKGLILLLHDEHHQFDERLGRAMSGSKGEFQFNFQSDTFPELFKQAPGIYVKVLDDRGNVRHESKEPLPFKAGEVATLKIELDKLRSGPLKNKN